MGIDPPRFFWRGRLTIPVLKFRPHTPDETGSCQDNCHAVGNTCFIDPLLKEKLRRYGSDNEVRVKKKSASVRYCQTLLNSQSCCWLVLTDCSVCVLAQALHLCSLFISLSYRYSTCPLALFHLNTFL